MWKYVVVFLTFLSINSIVGADEMDGFVLVQYEAASCNLSIVFFYPRDLWSTKF
jgi:hypothetical protein